MSPSPRSDAITGVFYCGASSRRSPARLSLAGDQLTLEHDGNRQSVAWHDLEIAPRVGNAPRYLHLPEDGVFETRDNDGVDRVARHFHQGRGARMVHRLENHLGLILVAAAATVLVTILTFTHGIPLASRLVAHTLPESVPRQLASGTLAQLDQFWLSPSELAPARQQELRAYFAPLLAGEPHYSFTVEFREGGDIGANALALPDGTIIFTDQMVNLAERPEELAAILAHEMGHVIERHGLQGVVQSSLVGWVIVMMTGDLSAVSDMTVVAPAILMNLAYSRDMEQQADDYAFDLMLAHSLDPGHFATIMTRIEASHENPEEAEDGDGWGSRLGGMLSTHPITSERIRRFQEAGE